MFNRTLLGKTVRKRARAKTPQLIKKDFCSKEHIENNNIHICSNEHIPDTKKPRFRGAFGFQLLNP
jgi:hypothetical protein